MSSAVSTELRNAFGSFPHSQPTTHSSQLTAPPPSTPYMHRITASVRSLNLATLGQGLCVLTLVLLLAPPTARAVSTIAPRVLLLGQVVCAIAVSIHAAHTTTGTRRTLFASLAAAGLLAIVSGGAWALRSAITGVPTPSTMDVCAGLGAQLMMMLGFATALGRYRHRNWMHFEAVVDAMLLVL